MKKILLALLICSLISAVSYSQSVSWSHTFGGPQMDQGYTVFQTKDGGFLMIGERAVKSTITGLYIPQTYLIKLDFNGSLLWQKLIGDSLFGNFAYSAVEDKYGNFYVPVNRDMPYLYKFDASGRVLWVREYSNSIIYQWGLIRITKDYKTFIIEGTGNTLFFKINMSKLDSSGNMIWSRNLHESDSINYNAGYFQIINDGYYVPGSTGYNLQTFKGLMMRLDTSGNIIWEKIIEEGVKGLYSLAQNSENSFIVDGMVCGNNICDTYCIKFDNRGGIIWQRNYIPDSVYSSGSIVKTHDGLFAIVGAEVYGGGEIILIDSLGNLILKKKHQGNPQSLEYYRFISNVTDTGFIITGRFTVNESGYPDCLIVKTDKYLNAPPIGIFNLGKSVPMSDLVVNAYPNPFNTSLTIKFLLSKGCKIKIEIYDLLGKGIVLTDRQFFSFGQHSFLFDAEKYNLASGIYFLKIMSESEYATKKIVYLK